MPYYTVDSNHSSPSQPDRQQTQSQGQALSNTSSQITPTPAKPQSSSLRLPRGTSFKLYLVISKFEALDALSLPSGPPVRLPPPLQIPRKSTRPRGRTGSSHQQKLTAIFSPRNESRDRYGEASLADGLISRGEDIFSSTKKIAIKPQAKSSGRGRLRSCTASNKPSSIRLRGGVWDPHAPLLGGRNQSLVSQKETPEKRHPRTVRDIVSFYDGAVSVAANTPVKLSLIETPQPPLSRARTYGDKTFSLSKNLSSKPKVTPRRSVQPDTPTKYSPLVVTKNPTSPNALNAQTPAPKSPPKSTNPGLSYNDKTERQLYAGNPQTLPVRGLRAYSQTANFKKSLDPPPGGIEIELRNTDRSGPKTRSTGNENSGSVDKRKISDKIEKIYQAKSLERQKELSQDLDDQSYNTKLRSLKPLQARGGKESSSNGPSRKIASMRKLFEKGSFSEDVLLETPIQLARRLVEDPVPTSQEKMVIRLPTPPPPSPPLPTFCSPRTTSNVSPKTVPQPKAISMSPINTCSAAIEKCNPITRHKQMLQTNNEGIWNKIKIFEVRPGENEDKRSHQRLNSFTQRMKRSLVGMHRPFNASAKTSAIEGHEVGPSGKDLQDIYAEFQEFEEDAKPTKRKSCMERWNCVSPKPTSTGTDGAASQKTATSPLTEDLTNMVIKEVECCLREPKPLRIVEMKRMMMLCRGRAGIFVMDNEKGKSAHSRKLLHK